MALEQLRAFRAGRAADRLGETSAVGPDGFPLLAASELAREHASIGELLANEEIARAQHLPSHPAIEALLAGSNETRTRLYLALLERIFAYDAKLSASGGEYVFARFMDYGTGAELMAALFDAGLDRESVVVPTLEWFTTYRFVYYGVPPLIRVLRHIRSRDGARKLAPELRELLVELHGQCGDIGGYASYSDEAHQEVASILGGGMYETLAPCEVWSAEATREIEALATARREAWLALLAHAGTANSARPSAKWSKSGAARIDAVGRDEFRAALLRWFPLVDAGRRHPMVGPSWEGIDERARMHEGNATLLRGLCWLASGVMDPLLTRAIGKLASSAYRKVRGIGPRASKVGNACIFALSQAGTLHAVGQLALAKARVKFVPAQKEIEKAFNLAAAALGLPRDRVEEMAVPAYGMEVVGVRRDVFGDGSVVGELRVDGRQVELQWFRDDKPQKSVPAAIKTDHKEEVRELLAAQKDIGQMLSAQADRIDACFLLERSWTSEEWRECYLDHPLVGTIARRLVWSVARGEEVAVAVIARDGRLVDVEGRAVSTGSDTRVSLWHPIGRDVQEVLAWRAALERWQVRQPFKQVHREVYVLTDAERRTGTYSNRFAAHVIRQHQFNALCGARGWRNKLRLMVDDEYPPAARDLARFGLRAEFWIEGVGDDFGTDTLESGAYVRLATDQVRFYRSAAAENSAHAGGGGYANTAGGPGDQGVNEPLPLDEIPPLVFSEIMRDVDLFVGVASVGNDPTWQDGGPGGRFRDYWHAYSFGDLGETAQTRRALLERLVPRLKIASRCELSGRFLVVRGDRRTYKIHIGSGNVLMEPNDQYLCIVPERSASAVMKGGQVFLPFEGDSTLSVVLSKAFLLAADTKITDPSILSQIAVQ